MTEQPIKRRRGCLFYGFLVGTMAFVILTGLLLGLLEPLSTFTDATPRSFPPVNMSSADLELLRHRVDALRDNVRSGRPAEPLSVGPNDINALISTYPDLEVLKGKLFIEGLGRNQIKAQVSVPTSQIPVGAFKIFKNRYINGTAILDLSFTNGTLHLDLQSLTAKGKLLPPRYLQTARGRNLGQAVNNDPRLSVALNKVQSIEVKDGKLVIVPAPPQ